MRSLSPDEAALWARVAATIRPLSRETHDSPASTTPLAPDVVVRAQPTATRPRPVVRPRPIAVGERTLDASWDKKLRTGALEPDRVLDLHGMNLDGAWAAIDNTLEQAIGRGERVILLITGHHRPGEPPIQRGQIRAAVHDWLAASRHAQRIAAVRGGHRRHGGGGSLYVVLRRLPRSR